MAHTVTITITSAQHSFAAGTVSSGIKVTLGTFEPQLLVTAPYIATFENVEPGDYNIIAVAVDGSGNELGDAITGSATVAPDNVNIDVPASMIVNVA